MPGFRDDINRSETSDKKGSKEEKENQEEVVKSFMTKTIQKALQPISKESKPKNRMATPTIGSVSSNQGLFALREELTNIRTLDLVSRTTSILEKIFWAIIAISGTIFIYDVVVIQLENWRDNPTLATTVTKRLQDLPLPAVTFCHKGLQKYGLVEHLGNHINPEKEVPIEVLAIRNEFLKVQFQRVNDLLNGKNFCEWLFQLRSDERLDNIILKKVDKEWKAKCIVSAQLQKITSPLLGEKCNFSRKLVK